MVKYVNKINRTSIFVSDEDVTHIPSDAILVTYNNIQNLFGEIHRNIQTVAGTLYHNQIDKHIVFNDLDIIIAKGDKTQHKGSFDNVIFIIDHFKNPLEQILYEGLKTSHEESYNSI